MSGSQNEITIPPDHEVLYQDDDLLITFQPDPEIADEELAHTVHFWFFELEDDDDANPVLWDDGEEIVLEATQTPGESIAILDVLTEWHEPQLVPIGARPASVLAQRFKKPLRAVKGPRLSANQELIHDANGCVAILDILLGIRISESQRSGNSLSPSSASMGGSP